MIHVGCVCGLRDKEAEMENQTCPKCGGEMDEGYDWANYLSF
jgi:hypothetical protein